MLFSNSKQKLHLKITSVKPTLVMIWQKVLQLTQYNTGSLIKHDVKEQYLF